MREFYTYYANIIINDMRLHRHTMLDIDTFYPITMKNGPLKFTKD